MSKNYEQIATVDIDIERPIVDDTSFDNLLIMGPGPAKGPKVPVVIPGLRRPSPLGRPSRTPTPCWPTRSAPRRA